MKAVNHLTLALALAFASPVHAGYLPDPAAVEAALLALPTVSQARGREEWVVGTDVAQRRIQTPVRDRQAEWGLTVSRPLRLPARAEADRALAGALTAHAEAGVGETLHESGRHLLALWFDWLNEASQTRLWLAQLQLGEQQLAAVNARIRLGEAPRSERVSSDAALAQVRLQQQQAVAREQQARSRLQAQFPGLAVVADEALPSPMQPDGTATTMSTRC